jgi:hypothetical protein
MRGVSNSVRAVREPTLVLAVAAGLCLAGAGRAEAAAGVAGRVLRADRPVAQAVVYAYHVVEKSFRHVATDGSGEFLFETLPAGLYKIVAHKLGSPPAVVVLARRAAEDSQYVQVELPAVGDDATTDFWALRSEVPSDVLRELAPTAISLASYHHAMPATPRFVTEIAATASRQELASSRVAEVAGAELDLRGALGELDLRLEGEFRNLASSLRGDFGAPGTASADSVSGRSAVFRFGLSGESAGRIGISGRTHELLGVPFAGQDSLDFSQYRIDYAREFDAERSTDISAEFLDEVGLLSASQLAPRALPVASRTWSVQGAYSQPLGSSNRIRAGLRYREAQQYGRSLLFPEIRDRYLDFWSTGEIDVNSTLVVHYGLFSTMSDGSVSLTPRGGVLLHLGPSWQASAQASHRIVASNEDPLARDFTPLLFVGAVDCASTDTTCYQLQLMHGDGERNGVELRGSWRQFDRTVRLFLREDFTIHPEGIFFVPGDELPEAQTTVHRRLGSNVAATWTTSYAAGGGGVYRAVNRRVYVNDIEYYTTALTAQILPSSTGIYVAFQRVEQALDPVTGVSRRRVPSAAARLDRLELAVSQDLSAIFDFASRWAVRVAMEIVRGGTVLVPAEDEDALRRGLSTSVAIRF